MSRKIASQTDVEAKKIVHQNWLCAKTASGKITPRPILCLISSFKLWLPSTENILHFNFAHLLLVVYYQQTPPERKVYVILCRLQLLETHSMMSDCLQQRRNCIIPVSSALRNQALNLK